MFSTVVTCHELKDEALSDIRGGGAVGTGSVGQWVTGPGSTTQSAEHLEAHVKDTDHQVRGISMCQCPKRLSFRGFSGGEQTLYSVMIDCVIEEPESLLYAR